MGLPEARFVLRIFVPDRFLAGPPEYEYVFPSVAIKVIGVGKEIIGIPVFATKLTSIARCLDLFSVLCDFEGILWCNFIGINNVAFFKVRAGIPIGADHHIALSVMVKITKVAAFRPEVRGDMMLGPSVNLIFGG